MASLEDRVTADMLERLAGPLVFKRGRAYLAEGRVGRIRPMAVGDGIEAPIRGSSGYWTRLRAAGGGLTAECTCPMGTDGQFCKHAVALGLAWLDRAGGTFGADENVPAHQPADPPVPPESVGATRALGTRSARGPADPVAALAAYDRDLADIQRYLGAQPTEMLVELVMTQVGRDPRLMQRLLVDSRTTRLAAATPDRATSEDAVSALRIVKSAIDRATRVRDFVRYRDVPGTVDRARDAADLIDRFASAGRYEDAVGLTEHVIRRVEAMLDKVDDSDGLVGDLLGELQERHLDLCRAARPDPRTLARRLFAWEMASDWEVFGGSVETYADVLGPDGLAEYRRLAEARWADVGPLKRGDPRGVMDTDRFRITRAMESLAAALDDVDGLIAVQSADLSSPYRYVELAQTCLSHGRREEAIRWAMAGIGAWPEATDSRIHDFLADRYEEDGRLDEAMQLAWHTFLADSRRDRYQALRTRALRAGTSPTWRGQALAFLREEAEADLERAAAAAPELEPRPVARGHVVALPSRRPEPPPEPPAGIRLVDILLWEGDADAAWGAAREFGCAEHQWQRLARERLDGHPEDAVPILRRDVDRLLRGAVPDNYPEAVELIARIGRAMAAMGQSHAFAAYVADLRAAHGRKRKFIALLDRLRIPAR